MDIYNVLVIILSCALILLLVVCILISVYVFKLVKTIKELTDKAASVVDSASTIRRFVSPAVIGRTIFDAVQKVIKNNNDKKEDK